MALFIGKSGSTPKTFLNKGILWLFLYGGLGLLFLVVLITAVIPAYLSPNSRLYAGAFGYPAVRRALDMPIPVQAEPVSARQMTRVVSAAGSVEYLNETSVNTEVVGIVTEIRVEPGEQVKAGQVLLKLDPGGHTSRIASLNLTLQESEFNQAKEDYLRELEAFDKGLIPRTTLEQFKRKYDEATISYQKAKEEYENSLRSRSKSVLGQRGRENGTSHSPSGQIEILSPVAGTILHQKIFDGENLVTPRNGVMIIGDHLVFRAALDQRYVSSVKKGDKARVHLSAYPGESFPGEVLRVDTVVSDIKSAFKDGQPPHTFNVWITLGPKTVTNNTVVPGMNGYATLEYPFESLTIPESALLRYSGRRGLAMTVSKTNQVELKPVTYTVSSEGWVAVASGLQPGEMVITQGQIALEEGDRVSLK